MRPGDRFVLGVDLVKDPAVLHAAYNDAVGVTAAFNRNILRAVSRALGGDIDVSAFAHVAFYDAQRERIEMHLEATRAMRLSLSDLAIDLHAGERIRTEISRKFTRASVLATFGKLELVDWFEGGGFALAIGQSTSQRQS
jgi:L-histidine N-alpha-methyltransferase